MDNQLSPIVGNKNSWVPSKKEHISRNNFNMVPSGELYCRGEKDQYNQKVFIDKEGRRWHQLKWYYSIFHNPIKNIKLQYYHYEDRNDKLLKNPKGSSEIIVNKKMVSKVGDKELIHPIYIFNGSYNYKDFRKTNQFAHFMADILPNVLYCSCIGK